MAAYVVMALALNMVAAVVLAITRVVMMRVERTVVVISVVGVVAAGWCRWS